MLTRQDVLTTLKNIYDSSEAQAIFNWLEEAWNNNDILETEKDLESIIAQLQAHTPIQYILGKSYFYDDVILLKNKVLIPRPETEELVDWVIKDNNNGFNIWDIGTGSGCIAVTLARKLPLSHIKATDINPAAKKNIQINAEHFDVNIDFSYHDILSDTVDRFKEIDVIVSNPPYIATSEISLMEHNVLDHEPENALFAPDQDEVIFYRKIADICEKYLLKIKLVYLEINPLFLQETIDVFDKNSWEIIVKKDMQGKDRMLKCIRKVTLI